MDTVVSLIGNDPRRIGGTEEYARELSSQLGRLGWRSVLCFSDAPSGPVVGYFDLPNVTLEVVREPWVNSFEAVGAMTRILRRYRPSVLHYMFTGFLGPFPWLAKACSVDKVFFTDQGSQPESYTPRLEPLWKRLAARLINLPLTGVISISEHNARVLRQRGVYPAERIQRIFNGVRLRESNGSGRAAFRRKYSIPDGRCVVLQVGWIIPEKGIADLIEAARLVLEKNPAVQFVLVGDGEAMEQFRRQAQPLGDHITWTGLVADPMGEGVYEAADVVCQVSRWQEGFGWVIAEAMSVERPLVGTRVGAIPELVEDGVTGFLVPRGDRAAMADRILRLLADPALRAQFGAEARRAVEAKFDLRDIVAQHLELFGIASRSGK